MVITLRGLAFLLISGCLGVPCALRAAGVGDGESSDAVFDRYVAATEAQESSLRGIQMTVDIQAELPKLKKQGKFHALRIIPKVGRITYDALHFEGDKTIKTDVIARYLQAEDQAQAGNPRALSINRENYKFKYKGEEEIESRSAYWFQLTPKKKRVGLFKGDLWVDERTCLPLRERGHFVKNPSVFLKKVEFQRDFEIKDGVAVPKRIVSHVDTRIVGLAELTIDFSDVKPADEASIPEAALSGFGSVR
jgi:hypothetical protein